jgi:protein-S-isoprenylcysteine O-methyltransferase Ste14
MDAFEKRIADALQLEDAEQLRRLSADQPLHELLLDVMRGRNRRLHLWMAAVMVLLFGLAVWCGVEFFMSAETRAMLAWGFGGLCALMAVGHIKLWYWLEMQKNSVVREVKRVELQVAALASRRT